MPWCIAHGFQDKEDGVAFRSRDEYRAFCTTNSPFDGQLEFTSGQTALSLSLVYASTRMESQPAARRRQTCNFGRTERAICHCPYLRRRAAYAARWRKRCPLRSYGGGPASRCSPSRGEGLVPRGRVICEAAGWRLSRSVLHLGRPIRPQIRQIRPCCFGWQKPDRRLAETATSCIFQSRTPATIIQSFPTGQQICEPKHTASRTRFPGYAAKSDNFSWSLR